MTQTTKTAEELRAEAADLDRQARESFERCDTDGFLSQWADGLMARLRRTEADLVEAGNVSEFWGLYRRADGVRVRAKHVTFRSKFHYGTEDCWSFRDENDRTVKGSKLLRINWENPNGVRTNLWKAGYEMRRELAPAKAEIAGSGYGLSGSAWVAVTRTDKGYPADAVVVDPAEGGAR